MASRTVSRLLRIVEVQDATGVLKGCYTRAGLLQNVTNCRLDEKEDDKRCVRWLHTHAMHLEEAFSESRVSGAHSTMPKGLHARKTPAKLEAGTFQATHVRNAAEAAAVLEKRGQEPETSVLASSMSGPLHESSLHEAIPEPSVSEGCSTAASVPKSSPTSSPDGVSPSCIPGGTIVPEQGDAPTKPLPGSESARSFLRDAQATLQSSRCLEKQAFGRITALAKRLGSVPPPQVTHNIDTFHWIVFRLLQYAASTPRVNSGKFLLEYARAINRHPRLLAALKQHPKYNLLMHRLLFVSPAQVESPAEPISGTRIQEDLQTGDTQQNSASEDVRSRHDASAWDPRKQLPRSFEVPGSFPNVLAALTRLRWCPPEFWVAIERFGIPSIETPAAPQPSVMYHGPRRNPVIVIHLLELIAAQYPDDAPREGLDKTRRKKSKAIDRVMPPTPGVLDAVEEFTARAIPEMSADDVVRTFAALGAARFTPSSDVLCALEDRAFHYAADLTVRHVAMLLGGLCALGLRPGPLLEGALSRRVERVVPSMTPHLLQIVMLQSAKMGATLREHSVTALLQRVREMLAGDMHEGRKFAPRLLMACAVYTAVHGPGFAQTARLGPTAWQLTEACAELWESGRLAADGDISTLLRQAHQSIEVLSTEHKWKIVQGTPASRFIAECRRVAREYAQRQVRIAQLFGPRLEVMQALKQLCDERGVSTVSATEVWGGDANFAYIMVRSGNLWVAVEVEGPAHIVRNTSGEIVGLGGKPLLRNWALRHWGGDVVSIVAEQWDLSSPAFREALRAELLERGMPVMPLESLDGAPEAGVAEAGTPQEL